MTFPVLALGVAGTAVLAGVFARMTRQYLAASIAASAVLLLLQSVIYYDYTADDSYISYRYARNLADGIGPVWNPGERVEGYSNFLWMALLAGFHRIGFDIPDTARALGFGLGVIAGVGTYAIVRKLSPRDLGEVAGFIASLILATCGVWALWATAGLEGPLFAALASGAVLLHLHEDDAPGRWPASAALWAFVAMTRPDGIALFAVSAAFKCGWVAYQVAFGGGLDGAERRARLMMLAKYFVTFAALFAPYFVWRYAYYGWLAPNTYYAKVGSGLKQYDAGLHYVATFLQQYAGWGLLIVPLAALVDRERARGLCYLFGLVITWFAMLSYVGGDYSPGSRFIAEVLPLYVGVIVASVAVIVGRLRFDAPQLAWTAPYATGGFVLAALMLTLHSTVVASGGDFFINGDRNNVREQAEVGSWLRANVDPATTMAVIAAGATPYESQLRAIDMLGLNDEHIAHRKVPKGNGAPGHQKYDSDYVLDQHPDIIILNSTLESTPQPLSGPLANAVIPAFADMVANPRFVAVYEARAVQVREGQWFSLFVRHDAAAILAKTVPITR